VGDQDELGSGERVRVVEAFGPTIQGEGPLAGRVCHFLRLGGCDYRCEWCDSMHAVEPELVREAPDLDEPEVARLLRELEPAPMLVISGGNPALWHLGDLLDQLPYTTVAVETQGSIWRPWLSRVQSLVVSPKPPSSGMATERHSRAFAYFMERASTVLGLALKVVVFDEFDLAWASLVADAYSWCPLYLSCGTLPDDTPERLGERYGWLAERVSHEPSLHGAVVLPQLHVIAWGHRVGV
jgi:7-carboxy-7-deazaguanine synthase